MEMFCILIGFNIYIPQKSSKCTREQQILFIIIILLLYLGYIVTFTKVLTIYLSQIHLLHHSPLSLHPHSWNSLTDLIFRFTYIVFVLYSPSYTHPLLMSFPLPLVPTPRQDLFYLPRTVNLSICVLNTNPK
jgi:hypothetical protein